MGRPAGAAFGGEEEMGSIRIWARKAGSHRNRRWRRRTELHGSSWCSCEKRGERREGRKEREKKREEGGKRKRGKGGRGAARLELLLMRALVGCGREPLA